MARGVGEFRWTLLPTLASYYVYRYERENGRNIDLRTQVHTRFGMPLNGSEMKVDRNFPEAYKIVFETFDGKKGSNHHDRYVVEHFETMSISNIEELYNQIMNENLNPDNLVFLTKHAIALLKEIPKEKDMYIAKTIEHGLDIREHIYQISESSSFNNELLFVDKDDENYEKMLNESAERYSLTDEELQKKIEAGISSVTVSNTKRWKRDKSVAWTALDRANHMCEIDESHQSFKRVGGKVNYVEPHHVIPISQQDEYTQTLDNIKNIISLCPNCHKAIHFADSIERKKYLEKVFNIKKVQLEDVDINISLDILFKMYNIKGSL